MVGYGGLGAEALQKLTSRPSKYIKTNKLSSMHKFSDLHCFFVIAVWHQCSVKSCRNYLLLKRLIINAEYIVMISLGLMNRFSTLFKAKTSTVLDKFEKPEEMLDYSFEKQTELLNKLRRDIAAVITAKKQLEM